MPTSCIPLLVDSDINAVFALLIAAPFLSLLLAYVTSDDMALGNPDLARDPIRMATSCFSSLPTCAQSVFSAGASVVPTWVAIQFVASFMGVALVLERFLPGKIETGPETLTGHVPRYVDNGVLHCVVFAGLFWAGSNLGLAGYYDFGIFYDVRIARPTFMHE